MRFPLPIIFLLVLGVACTRDETPTPISTPRVPDTPTRVVTQITAASTRQVTATPRAIAPTIVRVNAITPQANNGVPTRVVVSSVIIPTQVVIAEITPPAFTPTASTPTPTSTRVPSFLGTSRAARATSLTLDALRNQILFFTDREGGLYPRLYLMNADGSNPRPCDCSEWLTELARREVTSHDGKFFVYTRGPQDQAVAPQTDTQIWLHNNVTGEDTLLTGAAPTFPRVDYDPVWSPAANQIAWVTQRTKVDEIHLFDMDTRKERPLTRGTWEWYKHPTFSPDGSHLAFWSNRVTQRKQIWVLNLADGALTNLSDNAFNDWNPFWIK